MLTVRVIRKFHNDKGILIGYRIKDKATGEERDVFKDTLKQFVASGKIAVDNMTLTSDGRLIGHATPKDRPVTVMSNQNKARETVECVFTNGKKLACVMVSSSLVTEHVEGVNDGITFETGFEGLENIKSNAYTNVRVVDGKPDFSQTKKKSYKQLKEKLIKILEKNNIHFELTVSKSDDKANKYEYIITIGNYDSLDNSDIIKQIVYVLIENAMYDANLKPLYIDEDKFFVSCMTGINEVRKALKADGIMKM